MNWLGSLFSIGLWSAIKGFVGGGISLGSVATLYFRRRERRRREASGSYLIIKGGVDKNWMRWIGVTISSWTGTPLLIQRLRFVWPLGAKGDLLLGQAEHFYPDTSRPPPRRSQVPHRELRIEVGVPLHFTARVQVTPLMRRLPSWLSRLHIILDVQTLDADARTISFRLRSAPVAWSKEPQE
jgi:hypothetical protein